MSDTSPRLKVDAKSWAAAFRDVSNATNDRTTIAGVLPRGGVANNAPVMSMETSRAMATTLLLANFNSIPLDWAARSSVGGTHLNFFIVKQLPILPPEQYLGKAIPEHHYWELVLSRALELTYTSNDLAGYAEALGYTGPPFGWDSDRRHRLRSELDAIYAHMYDLPREDLEWILDAPDPSVSFPGLRRREMEEFGEYRTERYVLAAYDLLAAGLNPDLSDL